MKDIFLVSALVAVVYFVVKAVETKFVKKSELDIKSLAMDGAYVFVSSGLAQFALSQMGPIDGMDSFMGGGDAEKAIPGVFTNDPGF